MWKKLASYVAVLGVTGCPDSNEQVDIKQFVEKEQLEVSLKVEKENKGLADNRRRQALEFAKSDQKEKSKKALAYAASAVDLDPKNNMNWLTLGTLWLEYKENSKALFNALRSFEQVLSLDPGNKTALYLLGYAKYLLGDYGEARKVWEPLLFTSSKLNQELVYLIASCFMATGEVKEGIKAIEKLSKQRQELTSIKMLKKQLRIALGKEGYE